MKCFRGLSAALAMVGAAAQANAADLKTLRYITAAPPTAVSLLSPGATARPVEFTRIVVHPPDGETWGISYLSISPSPLADAEPLTWKGGASEAQKEGFARVFNEEARKAGFAVQDGDSLFDDGAGSADLKVGVLVDDLKGRFCTDCPSLLNPDGVPGTVLMTAHWEIYSSLERKVVAHITTSGGSDFKRKLEKSYLPVVFEGFRENVRQLLASDDFRRLVVNGSRSAVPSPAPSAATTPIAFTPPKAHGTIAEAARSVAIVYAADGQGSGFLVSSDGYVLTNQHVVGGSKYVKLKWSDGAETLGEVVRTDRRRDVALIKTDAKGRAALALRSGAVRQGEPVFAIGTPLDDSLQNTMTRGIVSAERLEQGQRYIQSDAGINHGNSGGPLLDEKGSVVGVAVSGILPSSVQMGLNFFIPIDDALKALALKPAA